MLKIYGRANSINVRKVLWLCAELGLPFERSDWGRGFRPTSEPEYLALNPVGVVPTIDDDGFVLRESQAIVRYLASKHGREDLYPASLRERALVEQWLDWAATDLYQGVRPVFLGITVKMADYADPAVIARGAADWTRQMKVLEAHLAAGNAHMLGNNFTIADIPIGLVVNRWMSIPFEKPALPSVAAYYDRLAERPGYREHGRNGTP
jgi:glutathione S-transferase